MGDGSSSTSTTEHATGASRAATVGDGSSSTSTTEHRGIGGGLQRQANEANDALDESD